MLGIVVNFSELFLFKFCARGCGQPPRAFYATFLILYSGLWSTSPCFFSVKVCARDCGQRLWVLNRHILIFLLWRFDLPRVSARIKEHGLNHADKRVSCPAHMRVSCARAIAVVQVDNVVGRGHRSALVPFLGGPWVPFE